jgi:DNA topoisomerase VI subunit B
MTVKLERTTFETSRAAEYFDARQLSALTGVPQYEFASVCLKELIDNALDACETAGVAPEVGVEAEYILGQDPAVLRLAISDNGPSMPPELINKILDYNVRVSDKMAYRSPTRGAQGNALKTVIGIPYALGSDDPITITARGVRHTIRPWVDPGGHVRVSHTKVAENGLSNGTRITLTIPLEAQSLAEDDARHWPRSFAAFDPHVTFRYQGKNAPSKEGEIYKSTQERLFKKYIPSEPTSPHWYSPASLKALVFSHIADAYGGGRDLPLGEFVRQFQGLSSTKKAKAVCSHLPEFKHLSDFEKNEDAVGELLARMRAESKPPKASALGYVGEDHFRAFFENVYDEVREFTYVGRNNGTMPSGLPFTFEFALATLDEPGHLYCGINFSPTFGDPLEGTALAGPKFKAHGIRGFLSEGHALPRTSRAWYSSPASVAVAAHIVTPAPLFLDRGKTRLDLEGA